ncbi:MAG: hypothetical protein J6M66_12405 [Lachnospiraceae bacterium]|nr:hypothetical protein [Lachnospiraceae bacterium]
MKYMQSWEIRQISHDEGYDEGRSQKLTEDIENVMQSFHVELQTACESLKITVEEYENAKKLMERGTYEQKSE